MKYGTTIFSDSLFISLSQFFTIPGKAFYISFSEEKQFTVTFTKGTHQILKNQIFVAESLNVR